MKTTFPESPVNAAADKPLPTGWRIVKLGDVCEIQLGKMLSPKSKGGAHPKPYLRNANVQWNRFDLSSISTMDFSEREEEKFALKKATSWFARVANPDAPPSGREKSSDVSIKRRCIVCARSAK